ncbi:hypothetical protein [Brevundimonas sp. Root1279]|uniref:hypothetical protein n=1 Tax=Brevundimonas sp. Root1279 TaxID=1736443 RepID=UPI0006F55E48|nr:hypothetical protein [Brevundimonas sp. Root1279]KQW79717.1 hypothetical protein ASC65_14305 [Brevundimonas sp. Root1279]
MEPLTYAKVDGPPSDWQGLKVIDRATGGEVSRVIEVNTVEGWLIRYRLNERGLIFSDPDRPDEAATERVEGDFEIRRP